MGGSFKKSAQPPLNALEVVGGRSFFFSSSTMDPSKRLTQWVEEDRLAPVGTKPQWRWAVRHVTGAKSRVINPLIGVVTPVTRL